MEGSTSKGDKVKLRKMLLKKNEEGELQPPKYIILAYQRPSLVMDKKRKKNK